MQSKKENAEMEENPSTAKAVGNNLQVITGFFKNEYPPEAAIQLIDQLEYNHIIFYLGDDDSDAFNEETKEHLIFLRTLKKALEESIGIKKLVS